MPSLDSGRTAGSMRFFTPQTGRANAQHDAADRAEDHGQFEIAIGCFTAKDIVIDRAGACRGEAQHEAVEGQMVVVPPRQAAAVIAPGQPAPSPLLSPPRLRIEAVARRASANAGTPPQRAPVTCQ